MFCNHLNRVCVFVIKKLSLGLGIFVLQQNCLGKTGISRKCLAIGVGLVCVEGLIGGWCAWLMNGMDSFFRDTAGEPPGKLLAQRTASIHCP